MTGPSEVDPAVLAGEPDSMHQLEGGDEDLLSGEPGEQESAPSASDPAQWQAADALLEGQPTALGE